MYFKFFLLPYVIFERLPSFLDCANGYEVVPLSDYQLDASSSYAEGINEADKTQSRIDHMPAMGKVNNTKGRGIIIGLYAV